jgi:predicted transcriptional regulator
MPYPGLVTARQTSRRRGIRDEAGLRQFVESLALVLTNAGMQRTSARTFAALLASESGRMTAKEIGDSLQVSPAAVSGAVRYLEHARIVRRGRAPGQRADHFELGEGFWYEAMASNDTLYADLAAAMRTGIAALGPSPARDRLVETRDFFDFVRRVMPALITRWRAARA